MEEEDIEAANEENAVVEAGRPDEAKALAASGEAPGAASWQEQDKSLRWRRMLRPEMEFLVTKESLHGQVGT